MSAESEGDVAAELGTNCNLEKTIASVCPTWRCPHQDAGNITVASLFGSCSFFPDHKNTRRSEHIQPGASCSHAPPWFQLAVAGIDGCPGEAVMLL
jgi:hypothetical protein